MECKIQIATVVDSLIFLNHYRQLTEMVKGATGEYILPKGCKISDLERTVKELEDVKVTAKELYPQMRVT